MHEKKYEKHDLTFSKTVNSSSPFRVALISLAPYCTGLCTYCALYAHNEFSRDNYFLSFYVCMYMCCMSAQTGRQFRRQSCVCCLSQSFIRYTQWEHLVSIFFFLTQNSKKKLYAIQKKTKTTLTIICVGDDDTF